MTENLSTDSIAGLNMLILQTIISINDVCRMIAYTAPTAVSIHPQLCHTNPINVRLLKRERERVKQREKDKKQKYSNNVLGLQSQQAKSQNKIYFY